MTVTDWLGTTVVGNDFKLGAANGHGSRGSLILILRKATRSACRPNATPLGMVIVWVVSYRSSPVSMIILLARIL